jgi:hypothetical protein
MRTKSRTVFVHRLLDDLVEVEATSERSVFTGEPSQESHEGVSYLLEVDRNSPIEME